MSNTNSESAIILPGINSNTQGFIQLPFNEDGFKEFLTGLLGKPQTITGSVEGTFNVEQNNINHIIAALEQRINQQNDAHLIQFNARIIFDDRSSVLINSFQEFVSYNEIRNVVSNEVHITLTYLIKFHDKNVPEKQEINISFLTRNKVRRLRSLVSFIVLSMIDEDTDETFGAIEYEVKHTARTWATDIISLLSSMTESLIEREKPIREFTRKRSGLIATVLAFLSATFVSIIVYKSKTEDDLIRIAKIDRIFSSKNVSLVKINEGLKYLATNTPSIAYDISFTILTMVFLSVFFILIYSALLGGSHKESFVLLTQASFKAKNKADIRYERRTSVIVGSIIINIILGIISSIIYDKIK